MNQILLICAVVALAGCGKKEEATPIEEAHAEDVLTYGDSEEAHQFSTTRITRSVIVTDQAAAEAEAKRQSTIVEIANPKIEKSIREELKKPTGNLTKADLEKVTMLILYGIQLTDVKGLEKFTQLEGLLLNANQLTSVKGLEKLTKLEELFLSANQLTDVKGLENLTKLKRLYLASNQLTSVKGLEKLVHLTELRLLNNPAITKAQIDELKKALPKCRIVSDQPLMKEEQAKIIGVAIRKAAKKPTGELTKADYEKVTKLELDGMQMTSVKGLEKLTQLTELSLHRNQLADVKGLEKLTQLRMLVLSNNQLTSVKGLEKLAELEWLSLRFNQLTDVEGLEKLTQLKRLYLFGNELTDVKGLEKLTQLEYLDLIKNQLTNLKGLENLTQLELLRLDDNPALTKAQIDELKKALPKCDIRSNPTK